MPALPATFVLRVEILFSFDCFVVVENFSTSNKPTPVVDFLGFPRSAKSVSATSSPAWDSFFPFSGDSSSDGVSNKADGEKVTLS